MKTGKRVKPRFPIEYRLLITPGRDARDTSAVTLIALRTVNEFTNFRYEIVVEPERSGRTIRLSIHGLRAPQVTIPGTGPAVFRTEYEGLRGTYSVVVSKLDREENAFSVQISVDKVTVKDSPTVRFVDIVTREEDW